MATRIELVEHLLDEHKYVPARGEVDVLYEGTDIQLADLHARLDEEEAR